MKTVAAGSIANPSTGSAPKSINDRVPSADQAAAARAAMSQSSKMSGAGNYSSLSNPMAGGNSPLGDTTVGSYDRAAQDSLNRSVAAAAPGLVGPSVPAGTAGFTKAQQDARFPGSPSYGSDPLDKAMSIAKAATTPIGANANLYSSPVGPSAAQKLAAEAQRNVFSGSENVTTASKVGKQFDDRVPEDQSFVQGTTVGMSPVTAAATLAPGVGPKMRNDSFRTAPQSPGNYGSYREAQAEKAFADSIGENIYGGTPVASASTPAAQPDRTVGFSNLANPNITPTDVRNTFANPDASWSAARNYGQISAPPAGSAAPGLASAQPYNDIMAAVDTAGRQPVASGVAPASVSTPVTSPAQEVADAYPSKPRGPSHKWGEKLERPFERVLGQPEGPSQDDSYLNKVDSFLSRTFGSTAADDSAYARLASNDDRGSNFEQPRPYVDNRSGAIAPMAAKTVIPKVVLPPLPPYVNYQNIPGVSSPAVALPPASQRILDYINGGYASGGLVGRQSRAFGGGMLDGFKMGGGRGQGMSAPAAAPAQAAAPQATTGGAWNLTAVGASDEPEKKTPPTGAYGQRVPDYASMSSKDVLQGWLQDQMKGLDGNSRQIVNYMDLFARLDAGGGGYGGGGGGGDGGGDGNNDDTNNVLGLTGPGTPGAWSGAKTGWRRGGGVNNSIASALRLARGMRS
jgi:hypothetical protein